MIIFLVISVVLLLYSLYEYKNVRIDTLKPDDFTQVHDIPESVLGKRIVYISDLQWDSRARPFMSRFAQSIMDTVNELEPDLIIIGGDTIHRKTDKVFHYLKQLKTPIISTLGNHDYKDLENVKQGLNEISHLLVNETIDFHGMQIVAVDDYRKGHPQMPDYQRNTYTLLLSHNPDYCETLNDSFDMILSGHTHGGMITLFGIYSPITSSEYGQKYTGGFATTPGGKVYVSSGLGGSVFGLPIRFFARPSIQVIDFRQSKIT
ncbi:phosphoesterase [Erysipelothrix sp. HDW6A]|uniref:metallophosphoesterase n=1 Tax=Erysipelothrix sp. HDW6A TaxID=2714928 RepID=UPI001409DEC6|nr:metallophosphoesterase [Erysipelothrix sp. HDW6A]QIK56865.1 phosphoesterase [Erysipelothrix sp. HDW6A]